MTTSQHPIGLVDATRVPRYAGPATFARLPRTDEVTHTEVAVLGIPFDSGVAGMFYRTDILEEAGYKSEDMQNITWNQFIEVSQHSSLV